MTSSKHDPYGYGKPKEPRQEGTKQETGDSIASGYLDPYDYGTSTEKLYAPVATRGQATSVAAWSGFRTFSTTDTFTTGFEPSYVRITANNGAKSFSIGTCIRSPYSQTCMDFRETATWQIGNWNDRTVYVSGTGTSAVGNVSFSPTWFSIAWTIVSTTVNYQWEAFA